MIDCSNAELGFFFITIIKRYCHVQRFTIVLLTPGDVRHTYTFYRNYFNIILCFVIIVIMYVLHFCFRTPSRALPRINGKEIDLYLLYVLVTAQGGWVKVSSNY